MAPANNPTRRTGTVIPTGIFQPTTPTPPDETPAVEAEPAEQGASTVPLATERDEPGAPARTAKATRRRRGKVADERVEGRRLYLSEGVHFRLRIYCYQKGIKLSEGAEELLDKALPRWDVSRVG